MMRHPIENPPRQIDPWVFARSRRALDMELPLSDTHTLKQWAAEADTTLDAEFDGYMDEYDQPHLTGHIATRLAMQCQRCLKPMTLEIERTFDYVIIADPTLEDRVEGAAEALVCLDSMLDLVWFIEEEALLAMPMIARHEHCAAPPIPDAATPLPDSDRQYPFAGLKDMINTKEQ